MSLSKRMIYLQKRAVQNALDGTDPGNFEPSLSLSINMMLDNELFMWSDFNEAELALNEQLARYVLEVLE